MKIFVTDLDGTLLKKDSIVDESVERAINLLKNNGYTIIAASGRVSSSIRYFMDKLGVNSYIIGNNGSIVLDKDDKIIYKNPIDQNTLKKIFSIANKYNIEFRMYDKDTYYGKKLIGNQINHMKISDNEYSVKFIVKDNIEDYVLDNNVDVYKLLLDSHQENYNKFYEELSDIETLELTYSGKRNLDCMSKEVSKYEAIKQLFNYLEIEENTLISIGDYYNDIDMVKNSDIGVAMGNACQELKDVAGFITDDVDDNGFEKAVIKIIDMNR